MNAMTKVLVAGAILAAAIPAFARVNWVWMGESTRAAIYVNNADVARPPNYVKVWTLLSYKSRQRGGWRSEKRLFMFSCRDQSLDWQQSMYYAEPMGEGDLLNVRTLTQYRLGDLKLIELDPSTKDPGIYRDAVPESQFAAALKSLC